MSTAASAILFIGGLLAIVAIALLVRTVRIVRQHERGVVERLGRYHATVEPGLRIVIPIIDRIRTIDMREQVVDVPPQEVITSDNVVVSVDAVVYYEPVDPQRLIYNVANFMLAVTKLAQTNLRNLVGDLQLDQALTSRDSINTSLRAILDEATDTWGVRVKRVEIQRIDPPADVMMAMHEQMKAERNRRAVVLQADGEREAAIARAEGAKQAAIREAEGRAEAIRTVADAAAFEQERLAEAEAIAVTTVFSAIQSANPGRELLTLKYFEALGKVADGQATKIYLPADATGMLGGVASIAEIWKDAGDGDMPPTATPGAGEKKDLKSFVREQFRNAPPPPPVFGRD